MMVEDLIRVEIGLPGSFHPFCAGQGGRHTHWSEWSDCIVIFKGEERRIRVTRQRGDQALLAGTMTAS